MDPRIARTISAALVSLAWMTLAIAQEDPHAACTSMGWVPEEILQRPVTLRAGTGNTLDTATTPSPEAQSFYCQGLNYLHGYVWIEAARSFLETLTAARTPY